MAYDRYGTRDMPRDERSRWQNEGFEGRERSEDQDRGGRDERGFFDRAGDEIASWFGDDEAERRRREDQMRDQREGGVSGTDRDRSRDYGRERNRDRMSSGSGRERGFGREDRGFADGGWQRDEGRDYSAREREYSPSRRQEFSGGGRGRHDPEPNSSRPDYRPMTGDYGRARESFGASRPGPSERGREDRGGYDRSQTPWGRDDFRQTSYASGAQGNREYDAHYHSWRQRHLSELDRDYDEYRRENQSRFESDFGGWRERRMQKRGLLGQVREHMEVVSSDDQRIGTVDRVAGDRIILTKSDPESGGVHHSLSCSDVDRVEGERVILDCSADQARQRWRDESRSRALFEREDQGEMGPRNLDRSFEGTYRSNEQ